MSGRLPGRQRSGGESDSGAHWAAELASLDAFEVALRNLLSTRAKVLELSRSWDRSPRLSRLSAPIVAWMSECVRDEIVEAIGQLREGIEAETGPREPEEGAH
jgi:hypothetical protein